MRLKFIRTSMKKHASAVSAVVRVVAVIGFVLLSFSVSFASSVVLRVPKTAVPEPASVKTVGGPQNVAVSAIKPATPLTVVWMLDTLDAGGRETARADLLSLYGQLHGRPLRLAVLRGDAVDVSGPFLTRLQLQRKLAEIESPVSALPASAVFDSLNANAGQFGSNWSPVVLVGKLPLLDAQSQAYAQALLSRAFATQQLRVFLLTPAADDRWTSVFQGSGGEVVHDASAVLPLLDEVGQVFLNVTWTTPAPPAGFVVSNAAIVDAGGQTIGTAADLATTASTLPTVRAYDDMQRQMIEAARLLQQPASEANLQSVRNLLLAAGQVNPVDPGVLRAEVVFCEKTEAFPEAVKAAVLLTEVSPADGSSFLLLGRALLLASDFDKADAALGRAAALQVPAQQLAEPYARLHLARKDERGALPYLEAALLVDNKRQDLWFLQGRAAADLKESALAIRSFEQGLGLGGVHVAEAGSLLGLYVAAKDSAKAHALAKRTLEMLPADAASRMQFAQMVDDAGMREESIAAWKSVLAVQPNAERGHVRLSNLTLESGNAKAAEAAADAGLLVLPKSGELYLAKSDAILKQGRDYEARAVLEQGGAEAGDAAVLERLAAMQETYGDRAPEAYALLANAAGLGKPARLIALERGFDVSLRDGNLRQAEIFAGHLEAQGHPEYRAMLGGNRQIHNDAVVPGGIFALSFVARIKNVSPDRFFAEYAHQVILSICANNCTGDVFTGRIQNYFATITQLESLGKRDGDRVTITLSLKSKDERNHTDSVLRLLGLQLHNEKGQLNVDRGEKSNQAKKQDILAALGVDEVGLQEALQAGKSFEFEIHDEPAAVYPNAKLWKDSFPRIKQDQFALMLLHEPVMARLYVGISTLDRPTLNAMIGNYGLFWFTGRPSDLLSLYGTSFALQGTHAAVPGGVPAEAVWSQMAGASPDHPSQFFQAMLQQKDSSLLTYFYTLSHLDLQHQAFFTANLTRFKRFYTIFAALPEAQFTFRGMTRDTSFTDLLRNVPLDEKGEIDFPGSSEVWTVAQGHNTDDKHLAKLMKKVSRAATPEVEDEILLRLAEARDKTNTGKISELDNFLAVSRIDAHRSKPLDEESALMLAQHYSEFAPVYSYFTDLSAVSTAGFHSFFDLVDRLRQQPVLEQNLALGQIYSLIEWVVLMERREVIDDTEAARLFSLICDRLAAANDQAARTSTALELAHTLLGSCGFHGAGGWDAGVRGCLLGSSADSRRVRDFDVVLDQQKGPGLDAIRLIADAAGDAIRPRAGAAHIAAIGKDAIAAQLPIPKQSKVSGKEKEAILLYDPADLQKLIDEWNKNAAKASPNLKTAQKLAGELLKALEPQVTLALAAPIYAYYLRSNDLIVSEDPFLLRKHRYFDFASASGNHELIRASEFISTSDGLGSYLQGSFAQFGTATGFAAAAGWKQGGIGGSAVVAEQIAAIRSATWGRLRESDQHLTSLRILAAREWIVRSAQDPKAFLALSEETSGLLSASRRSSLLNGIEERDWQTAWGSITLPDLFRLGGSYLRRFPAGSNDSPVIAKLRFVAATNDGSRLNTLGGIPYHVLGCSHTHLVSDAPYEEYERRQTGNDMAERTAEFSLFLAYHADSIGVQPAEWSPVAETLANKIFRASQMSNSNDWHALLSAYASLTNANLKNALEP